MSSMVFVVDDDISIREALSSLIAANGLQVECFASADEFLAHPASEVSSCLVLDVRMPGVDGFELQRRLATAGRQLPVIFITAHGDVPMAVRAMKSGAFEFLPKPLRGDALLAAIQQAVERDRSAQIERRELARIQERRRSLTARESEVVTRMVQGMLNKQIAADLGVSENTIKVHRRHIMKKMQAANFAELMLMMERMP
jgi:FixJ family two-component response regulator